VGLADGRPEDVRVDEPDSSAVEPPVFDEHENLVVLGLTRPRQGVEEFEDHAPAREEAAAEFTDHEWMTHDLAHLQAISTSTAASGRSTIAPGLKNPALNQRL
jgi:hypothetical protein